MSKRVKYMKWQIKCDFDGTITKQDSTDFVLENFAAPEWEEIEKDWKSGKISSTECMVAQAELINTTPEELTSSLSRVKTDPYFVEFIELCDFWNADVSILSDGYDFNISNILAREGLENLKVEANKLEYLGENNFKFTAQHHAPDCRAKAGPCKCSKIDRNAYTILIGDGRSDFCAAQSSDMVIAKDSLLDFCRQKGIPHIPFRNFRDVKNIIRYMLMNKPQMETKPIPEVTAESDKKVSQI